MPADPIGSDYHLGALGRRFLDDARRTAIETDAAAFGRRIVSEVAPLVAGYQAHPPRLEKYDGHGNPVERVVFDGDYHRVGDAVWRSGLLAHAAHPGSSFEQAYLFYAASLEGEMGHMCAATCTSGVVRVLRWAGPLGSAEQYLPRLASADPAVALRGAQYLTEVQGGSDVGANAVVAEPRTDGMFLLSGEKWFCSVADADVFLVMARIPGAPEGTDGLGCFLMPREIDGVPNGFSIRRLKDKLGTTSMASGEIDFKGAVAHPVGDPSHGFGLMVGAMLNASRWMNALGNVGMLRRAYLEALGYSLERRAFGSPIIEFPSVQRLVANIKVEWLAGLYSTWALTALDEVADRHGSGEAVTDPDQLRFHRFLVNANKLVTSQACTTAVRDAIEVLGGNGAIETFSPLPRLLRDSVVYEQWEGTHNVLTAQVARDMAKLGLLPLVVDRIEALLERTHEGNRVDVALAHVRKDAERALGDGDYAAWHFRDILVRLHRTYQAAMFLDVAVDEPEHASELIAASHLLAGTHLEAGYRPEDDAGYPDLIRDVLGRDLAG